MGKKLVGVITGWDIIARGCSQGLAPRTTKVKDVMTKEARYFFDESDLLKIIKRMEAKGITRMLVIDYDKKLIGLVSMGNDEINAKKKSPLTQAFDYTTGLKRNPQNRRRGNT